MPCLRSEISSSLYAMRHRTEPQTEALQGLRQLQELSSQKRMSGRDLCTGRSHSAARNLDIKTALGVFFSAEGRVVVRLPAGLPVTHRLADGLEDAAVRRAVCHVHVYCCFDRCAERPLEEHSERSGGEHHSPQTNGYLWLNSTNRDSSLLHLLLHIKLSCQMSGSRMVVIIVWRVSTAVTAVTEEQHHDRSLR